MNTKTAAHGNSSLLNHDDPETTADLVQAIGMSIFLYSLVSSDTRIAQEVGVRFDCMSDPDFEIRPFDFKSTTKEGPFYGIAYSHLSSVECRSESVTFVFPEGELQVALESSCFGRVIPILYQRGVFEAGGILSERSLRELGRRMLSDRGELLHSVSHYGPNTTIASMLGAHSCAKLLVWSLGASMASPNAPEWTHWAAESWKLIQPILSAARESRRSFAREIFYRGIPECDLACLAVMFPMKLDDEIQRLASVADPNRSFDAAVSLRAVGDIEDSRFWGTARE